MHCIGLRSHTPVQRNSAACNECNAAPVKCPFPGSEEFSARGRVRTTRGKLLREFSLRPRDRRHHRQSQSPRERGRCLPQWQSQMPKCQDANAKHDPDRTKTGRRGRALRRRPVGRRPAVREAGCGQEAPRPKKTKGGTGYRGSGWSRPQRGCRPEPVAEEPQVVPVTNGHGDTPASEPAKKPRRRAQVAKES
jgi:hypothetical protein